MEILTDEQEEALQRINEQSNKNTNKSGRVDINCKFDNLEQTIIDFLIQNGYLKSLMKENNYGVFTVLPTEKGKNYFDNKNALIKEKKKASCIKIVKVVACVLSFLITNGIAVAALIVSIIK